MNISFSFKDLHLKSQYTDELTPHMEWLTEKKVLATRDINSNSAGETEELIEKQEKVIDQLDKKRKVVSVNGPIQSC